MFSFHEMEGTMNIISQQRNWKPNPMIKTSKNDNWRLIEELVQPETLLEQKIIANQEWQTGAFWGVPRFGHPEGKVLYHINEVLANVDKATTNPQMRERLRLVTILHDTFKHLEEKERPRTDWTKHHAIYALKFAKKYTTDQAVLDVIELHDEAYYAWQAARYGRKEAATARLQKLTKRLGENLQLFYLFFKCDTQTGDKYQAPIAWLENRLEEIEVVLF